MRDIQNRKEKQYNMYTTEMTYEMDTDTDMEQAQERGLDQDQDLDHGVQFSFKAFNFFPFMLSSSDMIHL